MKYPLLKNVRSTNFPVVSETLSLLKCRDAFSRLGDQVCGIISLIAKACQLAETQKCVSTIFPRTYVKKIVVLLFLAFTAATQAVGQITFTPSTDITPSKVYELDAVAEGNSVSASFASKLNEIKAELNIVEITKGNFYMRWFVRPSSDTDYTNVQKDWKVSFSFSEGKLAETVEYGTAWCSNEFWYTEKEPLYAAATITIPEGVDSKGYQIVCLITNGSGYTFSNNTLTEKNIQIAVVFNIKTLEDVLADYPYPDLTSIQPIEKNLVYDGDVATIDLSLTDYKDEIQDYDKIKYLHLYLTDKDGKVIPSDVFALKETNTDGNLMETSSNVGYHLYYTDQRWETLFGNGNNNRARFVITKPDDSSWENLRVVAVFANSIAGMGTYGDYVISEPSTLTTAAIFTFITLEDVLADYPYPDLTSIQPIEKNLVYDGDVATIDLSLTDYKDEIQDYDKIKYLHLYLTDKDGKVIPSDVFALKETNTDGNLMETSSNVGYHLYYTDQRWETLFGNGNNNRARFVITKPDDSSWENLRVVAVFANSIAGMGTYGDYVISEPSTLTSAFVFSFKSLDESLKDYTLPDVSLLPTHNVHNVNVWYEGGTTSAVLDFFSHKDQIKTDYNGGPFELTKYLHFYVVNENGEAISDIYDATFTPENPGNQNRNAVPTPFGWYVYANGDNAIFSEWGQSDAQFTFSKPDNLDWAAIKVVAVLTDNVTGWEMNSGYVLKNPEQLKSAFVFTFKKMGFRHYEGIANKPGEWDEVNGNKMQLTHEWTYDKYVKPGEIITLTLPMRFDKGPGTPATGDDWEPQGYFRWYNYQTDAASTNLFQDNYGKRLVPMFDAETDENKGLFQWDIYHRLSEMKPTPENVAAIEYKAPASNWNGEAIACDVSRYIDGVDPSSRALLYEPTLSIRYIYNVYPAQKIADDIMNAIINSPEAVYETNGYTSICTNATASDSSNGISANIRLKLQEVGDYYFYPYKKCNENNVKPSEADFETSSGPVQAQKVVWRVFTSLGTQYKDLTTEGGKMYSLSLQGINNNGIWHDAGGGKSTNLPRPFVPGDMVYVIAYLSDGNGNMCPVARFNCRFYANTPPLPYAEGESASSLPEHRKLSYLRQNYNEVAVLNFDNDSPESTLAAPTTALDNMTGHPSQWNRRFYGFVYKGLYNQNDNDFLGLSPKHGDYGLYKSMNVPGVSEDQRGKDGYQHEWYYTSPFYDRTYEMTRGSQSGYFLYVDASEEARQIAAINFDGELCAGSTVVISAAVADLTDAATKPQLLFKLYGITENASGEITDRKLIHSFATGNFSDFGVESGKWYQVYVKSTLQYGTGVESFHKFLVVVDNYCDNTEGADYAIDDIRIYTRNSSVEVAQTSIPCEELGGEESHIPTAKYKVKILHETLIAWLDAEKNWICHGKSPTDPFYKYFYYRLCKADGTPAEGITYRVDNKIEENYTTSQDWGRCRVFRSFTNKPEGIDDAVYEYDEINNLYYIIEDDLTIPVPADGEKYYVSLCWPQLGDGKGTDKELEAQLNGPDGNWGTPIDICSAYSSLFEAIAQQPSITDGEGNVVGSLTIPCNGDPQPMKLRVQLIVPDPVNGGTYTLTGEEVKYNWSVVKDGMQKKREENVSTYIYTYNAEDISADGKLHLRLEPVTTQVFINGVELDLCVNPMDLALAVRTSGPQLELGFKDVTYQENTTRTVRVGLGQLEAMRNEGKRLVLPVHSYENMVESEDFHLAVKKENSSVTVVSTNDPTWTDVTNREIGKVKDLTANNAIIIIGIPEGGGAFHEGYAYDLSFQFYDEEQLATGQETCYGDAFFTLKIVPEYVTWTGAANEMMSTNWNNDQNWARSLRKEIYKGNDYTDYGEGDYVELSRQQAYVPMKFTKVTLPANMQSPRLAELGYSGEGIINNGLLNEFSYDATEDIEYDLMVRIDKDLNTDYDGDRENDYDCEKFYGNTCQEIYFKPQAELRHQEELVYERAWVEYEFQANKWQLLTSPLKNVYSGDMYVPKSNGRQETEAFIDIKFDGGASGIYSRVGYPIYQRSWGKTGSMVVVSKEDDYRHDYPADIDYGSWGAEGNEIAVVLNQWSHSYNDATVAYAPGDGDNGFSLRAHKRDQQEEKALIRLPKADTSYTYYNIEDGVEDEQSGGHDAVVKDGGNKHNLLADAQTEGDYAPVTMTLDNSEGNDIYLVSNPYMASLDMNLFFEANADVIDDSCRKLWTIVDGEVKVSPTESGVLATIAPGQAFFIKVPGGNGKEVKFTTNMVTNQKVDFNGNLQAAMAKFTEAERRKRAQQALVMTARSDGKKSTAIVRLNTEADEDFQDREDVETLYDSNLTDVPTLYTIAGDQAVSVNSLPAIGAVPLGIVCATDTQAEVTFSGVSAIPGELYLYDRETGSSTLLSDSVKLHLQANAHGRYFLTGQRVTSGITNHEVKGIRCYSPAPGQLTIACLDAGNQLERVDIYTIDGKKEYSNNDINAPALTIRTHRGVKVVVIKHTGNNYAETAKVAVN